METEDKRNLRLIKGFVPDRYDLIKIAIFLGVLFVAFYAGYLLKEVYVCKVWVGDQIREFNIWENITLWNLTAPDFTRRTGS